MSSIKSAGENSGDNANQRVTICAATCRRPAGLRRLIEGLAQLTFSSAIAPEITIVIVDNSPDGGAREIVESMRPAVPWPMTYVHESKPGIPHARNAALDAAKNDADWMCFIDDDEKPQPNWLDKLLRVQQTTGAAVVTGPVEPQFHDDVADWAKRGGFFHRARRPTATELPYAFTCNVLFDAAMVRKLNLRFDPRFAGTMGEDRDFFERMAAAGARVVWADDAVVIETIPASRARARPLIRRMYEIGRSTATIESLRAPGLGNRMRVAAKSIVWIIIGCGTLPLGLLARRWAVRSLRWLAYGWGLIAGGFSPHE